jgi:hypothetical protein
VRIARLVSEQMDCVPHESILVVEVIVTVCLVDGLFAVLFLFVIDVVFGVVLVVILETVVGFIFVWFFVVFAGVRAGAVAAVAGRFADGFVRGKGFARGFIGGADDVVGVEPGCAVGKLGGDLESVKHEAGAAAVRNSPACT